MVATKKYICSFCARPFSRSEHKLRHERSHTQTKPFICLCCNTSFVRRDLLQRHLRNVHKLSPSAVNKNANATTSTVAAAASTVTADEPVVAANYTQSSASMTSASDQVLKSPSSPVFVNQGQKSPTALESSNTFNFTSSATAQNTSTATHRTANTSSPISMPQPKGSDNDYIIKLLTISRSYSSLQLTIKSHLPTLFFLYGTNSTLKLFPVNDHDDMLDTCIYSILANGASFTNMTDCINLFNKSWIENNNDLKNLTILAYTYLENYEALKNRLLIPIEMLFEKLDSVFIDELTKLETQDNWSLDYWKVYDIQSQYCFKFNKVPSSSHSKYFLKYVLIEGLSMNDWLISITKTLKFPQNEAHVKNLLNCIINELQNLRFNNVVHHLDLMKNPSKYDLHNAIIMFNKLYISQASQTESSTTNSSLIKSSNQFETLFQISKRHILLNVPQSFQDLIIDYVILPQDQVHIRLLALTLKEFEYWNAIRSLSDTSSSDDYISWFKDLSISILNNNLGLISYPLLFLGCLPLKSMSVPDIGFKNHKGLIIEVFLILLKLITEAEKFNDNVVLKGVVYLIKEMSHCDHSEDNVPMTGDSEYANLSDCLNKNQAIRKLFDILSTWLTFLDSSSVTEIETLRSLFYSFTSPLPSRRTSVASLDEALTESKREPVKSVMLNTHREFESQLHYQQQHLKPPSFVSASVSSSESNADSSSSSTTSVSSLGTSPQASPTMKMAQLYSKSSFTNDSIAENDYTGTKNYSISTEDQLNADKTSKFNLMFSGMDGKIKLPPLSLQSGINSAPQKRSASIESYKC